MSYPPQGGGWQQDQQGAWQQPQPGGWQDPAGGYQNGGYPPGYADPASSQPAYIDPVSGQPTSYPGYGTTPVPAYPTSPNYGYGYQPGYAGYTAPVMAPTASTNGLSIASLVVSLVAMVSLPCYGVGGIVIGVVGAILGHVGKKQIVQRGEQGGGMALAGIIIGWISVVLGLAIVAFMAFFVWWAVNTSANYPYPTDYPTS
jgi:hypothetical protein